MSEVYMNSFYLIYLSVTLSLSLSHLQKGTSDTDRREEYFIFRFFSFVYGNNTVLRNIYLYSTLLKSLDEM